VNELQVIREHLATQRRHLSEVIQACSAALQGSAAEGTETQALLRACASYFELALGRLAGNSEAAALARRASASAQPLSSWQALLAAVHAESGQWFDAIDALASRDGPLLQWRQIAHVDADTILGERQRFERVQALRTAHG